MKYGDIAGVLGVWDQSSYKQVELVDYGPIVCDLPACAQLPCAPRSAATGFRSLRHCLA